MLELGGVNICCKVLMISSCLALPREGHLQLLFCMVSHLEKHHNTKMVFSPTTLYINPNMFRKEDWPNTVYTSGRDGLKEDISTNLPEPPGKGFTMRVLLILIMLRHGNEEIQN